MNQEHTNQLRQIVSTINYMAGEVNLYMAKVILNNSSEPERYASRYEVTQDMNVVFQLYNTDTETTVTKKYDFVAFSQICSEKYSMMATFEDLVEQMVERSKSAIKGNIELLF